MPVFKYTGRDAQGNLVVASREAEDRDSLIDYLRKEKIFPIDVKEEKPFLVFKFKNRFLERFTFQLSGLLDAGIELPKALSILLKRMNMYWEKDVISRIKKEVVKGRALWQVLSESTDIFSPFYISMIKAGETTGSLDKVLGKLTLFYEEKRELRDRFVSMLIYPLILILVGAGTIIFLVIYILPKMMFIFKELEVELPLVTRIFLSLSTFLSKEWKFLIILIFVLILLGKKLLVNKKVREKLDKVFLKIPFLNSFIYKISFVRFAGALELALLSGLPLLEALDICQEVIPNSFIINKLSQVRKDVAKGITLSESLRKNEVFSSQILDIILVSEEAGNLEDFLPKVAKSVSREVKNQVERFLRLLEPMVIFVLALAVGFLVTAVLLPIFQINLQTF